MPSLPTPQPEAVLRDVMELHMRRCPCCMEGRVIVRELAGTTLTWCTSCSATGDAIRRRLGFSS